MAETIEFDPTTGNNKVELAPDASPSDVAAYEQQLQQNLIYQAYQKAYAEPVKQAAQAAYPIQLQQNPTYQAYQQSYGGVIKQVAQNAAQAGIVTAPSKAPTPLPPGFIGPPAPGEVVSPTPAKSAEPSPTTQATPTDAAAAGAVTALKGYQDEQGNYNIDKFLLDSKSPGQAIQTLRDAGFTQEQIQQAAHQNLDLANQARQQVEDEYGAGATAKFAAHEVADMVVPGLSTAENWGHLSLWQKIVYPALDALVLVPVVGEAAKLTELGAKGLSEGAKIAALGGRDAVDIAAKDAAVQLDEAVAKQAGTKSLLREVLDRAASETQPEMKAVYEQAAKFAQEDVEAVDKQLPKLTENVNELQNLSKTAAKLAETGGQTSLGARIYQGAEKVATAPERAQIGIQAGNINVNTSVAKAIEKGGAAAFSGTAAATTIIDWKNLSPTQKAAGIVMAALPLGVFGKARNLAENVADPYKIPYKAIGEREMSGEYKPGYLESEAGGEAGGTIRLVIDPASSPEAARNAMAQLMRQLHEDGGTATVEYAGHELKLRGTDFQKTVGGDVSFSGTPMGEVFKEGSGAFGTKTKLESYLTNVNEKLSLHDKPVTIEAKYKFTDPETGKIAEKTVKTNVMPGTIVKGKEGGLYTGQTLYSKFAHQAAYGAKGQTAAGLILHDAGIEGLPGKLAREKLGQMEKDAERLFNGARDVNEEVEGFKKYKNFIEAENVVTNGSQLERVQNLRSSLADKLNLNRGEYYTRDSRGKIELFQMYLEGGRTTPYTLKELYQLKGNALKNALGDVGVGLKNKFDELRGKRPTPVEEIASTKEENIASKFAKIDDDVKAGKIKPEDVNDAKRQAIEDIRDTARDDLRRESLKQARDIGIESLREGAEEAEPRTSARIAPDETARPNLRDQTSGRIDTGNRAAGDRGGTEDTARADTTQPPRISARTDATTTDRVAPAATNRPSTTPTRAPESDRTADTTRATPIPTRAPEPPRPPRPSERPPDATIRPPQLSRRRITPETKVSKTKSDNPPPKEETQEHKTGPVVSAWRQGQLHGKPVIKVVRAGSTKAETYMGQAPEGVSVDTSQVGKGSARRSARVFTDGGKAQSSQVKVGMMNVDVLPVGDKKSIDLRFRSTHGIVIRDAAGLKEPAIRNRPSSTRQSTKQPTLTKANVRNLGGGIVETNYHGIRRRHLKL